MISLRVHPPKPVVIKCDFDMKGELDRAGDQLEKLSAKTTQHK
jgi:hypothetical protein